MASTRSLSLALDVDAVDEAHELGIDISAVANEALHRTLAEARRNRWLAENEDAFAAQATWHEKNGHPLAAIIATPSTSKWTT